MDVDDLNRLWFDWDSREQLVRRIVSQQLAEAPPPRMDDCIVATYFLALRSKSLAQIGAEFSYHATSGVRNPPANSIPVHLHQRRTRQRPGQAQSAIGQSTAESSWLGTPWDRENVSRVNHGCDTFSVASRTSASTIVSRWS